MPKKRPAPQRRPKKARPKLKRKRTPVKNGKSPLTPWRAAVESQAMVNGTTKAQHPVKVWLFLNGKTQTWLSEQTGLHAVVINRYLNDSEEKEERRPMTRESAEKIVKAIGETLEFVLGKPEPASG